MKKISYAVLCFLSGLAHAEIQVSDAWVRLVPKVMTTTAAYMVLENKGEKAVELVEVHSPQFAMAHSHETVMADGMAKMSGNVMTVPAQGKIILAPEAAHIMLMGTKQVLAEGEMIELNFLWKDGSITQVIAPVKKQ